MHNHKPSCLSEAHGNDTARSGPGLFFHYIVMAVVEGWLLKEVPLYKPSISRRLLIIIL